MLPIMRIIDILHIYYIDVLILGLIDKLLAMLVKKLAALRAAVHKTIAKLNEKTAAIELSKQLSSKD